MHVPALRICPERRPAVVGILGGMGPLATVDFYEKVVRHTPAVHDQEHLHVVVWADPTVPDRSAALAGIGPDPTQWLIHGTRQLEAMGANLIATPCNTAHAFLPRVREIVGAQMLDMIEETAREIRAAHAAAKTVGLLATSGTLQAQLYQRALKMEGLRVLVPDVHTQRKCVGNAIALVKAGDLGTAPRQLVEHATTKLAARGAEVLVAGCTELPLLLDAMSAPLPVIDPTAVLARAVVQAALGHRPQPT